MSKTISAGLKTHLGQVTTTTAHCWKIVRSDAVEYYFTDHDQDIMFEGDVYSASVGFVAASLRSERSAAPDNIEVSAFYDDVGVTKALVEAGIFDLAVVDVFLVNYEDLTMGKMVLLEGWTMGNAQLGDYEFIMELRSLAAKLGQTIGDLYTPHCRVDLGSTKCGVNLTPLIQAGTVLSAITSRQIFDVSGLSLISTTDPTYFDYGVITWTAGLNTGLQMEIKSWVEAYDELTLFQAMPYEVVEGDTFNATPGCSKSYAICSSRFSNGIEFRGEPFIPGEGSIPISKYRGNRGGAYGGYGR